VKVTFGFPSSSSLFFVTNLVPEEGRRSFHLSSSLGRFQGSRDNERRILQSSRDPASDLDQIARYKRVPTGRKVEENMNS